MCIAIRDTFLASVFILQAYSLPTSPSAPAPTTPCTTISSQPSHQNFTSLYTCSLKADYAILGLFYDTCIPSNDSFPASTPSSTSSTTKTITINTFFCCDPTYTTPQPGQFDAMCIWGPGVNMTQWRIQGHPRGQLPSTSAEEMRGASCLVSPIIDPVASCVQVPSGTAE